MKNVCKKLFSLMLVAVLLVSIVPFSAMAADDFNMRVKFIDEAGNVVANPTANMDGVEGYTLTDADALLWFNDHAAEVNGQKYDYVGVRDGGASFVNDNGKYVFTVDVKKHVDEPTTPPTTAPEAPADNMRVKFVDAAGNVLANPTAYNGAIDGYVLSAADARAWFNDHVDTSKWQLPANLGNTIPVKNANGIYVFTVTCEPKTTTTPPTTEKPDDKEDDKVSAKEYTVKLKFYTNDNATAVRVVDITNTYALDNVIAWKEVQQYVKDNFVSSNSLGINIDGIYKYEGSAWSNWVTSGYKASDVEIPAYGYRHDHITLMVMLTGYSGGKVSLKSSSNNNSDNPKTGDNIFVAVTFMAVSATALTAVYVYNKKRMVK